MIACHDRDGRGACNRSRFIGSVRFAIISKEKATSTSPGVFQSPCLTVFIEWMLLDVGLTKKLANLFLSFKWVLEHVTSNIEFSIDKPFLERSI